MTKLYKATKTLSTVFFSDSTDKIQLKVEAETYLEKEEENIVFPINISEVSCLEDLPENWNGKTTPWGLEPITCAEWFSRKNNEKLKKVNSIKAEIARLNEELNSLMKTDYENV